jgi:hypothetical protein
MRVSAPPHEEGEQCHHGDTDDEGGAKRRLLEGDVHSAAANEHEQHRPLICLPEVHRPLVRLDRIRIPVPLGGISVRRLPDIPALTDVCA